MKLGGWRKKESGVAEKQDFERNEELTEERKAADGKARRLTVEVTEPPKVKRRDEQVVSADIVGKAAFKGTITLHLRGDAAAAYWSVTPGMRLSVSATERDDREYDVDQIDLLPAD